MNLLKTFTVAFGTSMFAYKQSYDKFQNDNQIHQKNAICILYPSGNSGVIGLVAFNQESPTSKTKIVVNVKGLKPNSLHGFHIHEFGDLTDGCTTAGPHYNPFNLKHGGPLDKERHLGDLGNLKTDQNGNAYMAMTDSLITLFGENSISGRSCVVHNGEDDLGKSSHPDSQTTGNSGARVACGVIGLSKEFKNVVPH